MNKTTYFLAFHLALGAVFFQLIRELAEFSWNHDYCTYIVLVPGVTAWLLYLKWKEVISSGASGSRWGWVLMAAGVACYLVAIGFREPLQRNDFLTLAVLGLVVAWTGGFLSIFGWNAFRAALFPIGFLIFLIPIPSAILESMIHGLQLGSTWAAERWFDLMGIPVDRDGFVFTLPHTSVQVAEECSGMRSCLALCLTGLLFAHVLFDRAWINATAFALAVPVSIVKNGFRIMILGGSLSEYGDSWIIRVLHSRGGVVFFALALAVLMVLVVMAWKLGGAFGVKRPARTGEEPIEDLH